MSNEEAARRLVNMYACYAKYYCYNETMERAVAIAIMALGAEVSNVAESRT